MAGALLVLASLPVLADPKFPVLSGRIVDEAGLLTPADHGAVEQDLTALEAKSSDQLVVYTARSLQGYPIEDFGYRLGRFWQVGQQGKNNGAILIVAPAERKVRIEVGRGLEPQLTDLMSKLIIENAILPAFRRNDFAGGIRAGVRDIRDVLLGDAEAVKERARKATPRPSGGDGAFPLLIFLMFVAVALLIVWMQARQTAHPSRAVDRRRRGDARRAGPDPSWTWGGSSGGWSGSSDGGGGGGGFSGGGGDFGGGGSSGSW